MSAPARPLDAATLARLRAQLAVRREELAARVARDHAAERSTDTNELPDPLEQSADRVLAAEFRDLAGSVEAMHDGELARIDAALERIEAGSYGECESCGAPIGTARLEAYPTAVRCVKCQAQSEARTRS